MKRMSKFKRMRLVPEITSNKTNELKNVFRYETPTNQRQMSDLDDAMKRILNSDLDEYSKSKQYSETLRKFLTFKNLSSQSDQEKKIPICLDIDSSKSSFSKSNIPIKRRVRVSKVKKTDSAKSAETEVFHKQTKKKIKSKAKLEPNLKLSHLISNLLKDKSDNESIWEEFTSASKY